jgi:cytochrome c-type biogenesis protein CcsB
LNTVDVRFFEIAFIMYSAGFFAFILYLAFKRTGLAWLGTGIIFASFVPHTLAVAYRWSLSGHPPLANTYEFMSTLCWLTILAFIVITLKYRKPIIGLFVSGVTFILMASASLLPKDMSDMLVPALQSYWFNIHISVAVLGEAAFAVAFGVSILYLLKSAGVGSGSGDKKSLWDTIPSLEVLDELNYRSIAIGYPLFTIGALFAGAIWAHQAWGTFWGWDPKEVSSLVIFIFYTLYLHARLNRNWKGKRAAWLSIIGFLSTLMTVFSAFILGGLHSYG